MIARFFVDRPIFATVISLVIMLAGMVAVFTLPVALYPDVTPATVQVYAIYPGANATTVRDTVAAPIEEQVSGVEGMMYMSSRCTNDGTYILNVTFKLGTDSDMAQVLVQNRVSLALPVIPALVQNEGITVKKMSPNTLMIVNLVSPGKTNDDKFLSNYATINVRDELGRLPGVAGVSYIGQRDYSLRAWLDPDKLAALGISAMDVVAAVASQNIQVAAGMIGQRPVPSGQQFQLTVNTQGRLVTPEEFGDIIIKGGPATSTTGSAAGTGSTGGIGGGSATSVPSTAVVRLSDVCTKKGKNGKNGNGKDEKDDDKKDEKDKDKDKEEGVELGAQQYDQTCTLDGDASVALTVYQTPGSNALDTAKNVYQKMKELKTRFPDDVDYKIVYDTTPFVRQSVNEVWHTLIDAVILVAIVVLLFLQDWRAMILPMIDVPVSLIGTFAIMSAMGFSLNSLTLFGLVLAIGIVVDDAIVVLENIERQMATGLDARTATIKAMEEITGPVMAITLVLAAVFVPCCFLGGITGQFFRQFAVTIAVSTLISAVNALTMTPSRAVLIFKGDQPGHKHKHEALPWWIFGVLGGIAAYEYLPDLLGGHWLFPALPPVTEETTETDWGAVSRAVAWYAPPGILLGGLFGWFFIKPVNAGLGWFFRLFNRGFDWTTEHYGRAVANVLRVAAIVLAGYGGLLALTYFQFTTTPTGFIPEQDKGYLILNVQLPDSASVERTDRAMKEIDKIVRDTSGVKHTLNISGRSLILNANAPNLASMYVMLDGFDMRQKGWYRLASDVSEALKKDDGVPEAVAAKLDPAKMNRDRLIAALGRDPQNCDALSDDQIRDRVVHRKYERVEFKEVLGVLLAADEYDTFNGVVAKRARVHRDDLSADEIAASIQKRFKATVASSMRGRAAMARTSELASLDGAFDLIDARVTAFGAPPVDGLGTTGGFNLILETRGSVDLEQLDRVAEKIVDEGNRNPELSGLFTSAGANTPWLWLDIDRDKCLLEGVQVSDIFNTLQVYLGSYYVNNFNVFGRTWQVNLQADPRFRSNVDDILRLQVRNTRNQMVRMGSIMTVKDTSGPVVVMRYNLYSAASITGNAGAGTGSGEAIKAMEALSKKQLAYGMKLEWTELAYLQNQAGNSAMWFFVLAVVFVFLVLAAQYESWKLPLAVILVVPMCLLCSIVGVQIAGIEVTVFTQIGFVVLVGLACKNAILIVEFAKQKQEDGKPRLEATVEAARQRLRPIVMTSFAFIFGVLPLVYAQGAGAEMRRSLGVAVFAGMLGVTMFGIFLTPVFYSVIQWFGAVPGATTAPGGVHDSHDVHALLPATNGAVNGDAHPVAISGDVHTVTVNGEALVNGKSGHATDTPKSAIHD